LLEPRSYDYNRIKAWDDRLRMPQFRFARARRQGLDAPRTRPNEFDVEGKKAYDDDREGWKKQEQARADAHFKARLDGDEAEEREAIMTFVLGLVAEPIPLKYVNNPKGDRAAESAGRQVLDKYNCAGCHQIRPGVYEFKARDAQAMLETSVADGRKSLEGDYDFHNTTAWVGLPQTGERLQA